MNMKKMKHLITNILVIVIVVQMISMGMNVTSVRAYENKPGVGNVVTQTETVKQVETATEKQPETTTQAETAKQPETTTQIETTRQPETTTQAETVKQPETTTQIETSSTVDVYNDILKKYAQTGFTGMAEVSGEWKYFIDGSVSESYMGMAENQYGWWYFSNGRIEWNYTGMAENPYGWWYFSNGRIDWEYTGMAENPYGWWYFSNGRIEWNYTGMAENPYGWWYFNNGRIDWHYTGWASNQYGNWHFTDGSLDWDYREDEGAISCWGDSMTYGQYGDGISYPSALEEFTGKKVYNMGISGETSVQISIRAGGISMYTAEDIVLTKGAGIDFKLYTEYDNKEVYIDPIHNGYGDYSGYNWAYGTKNKCYINGQAYNISYNGDTHHIYDQYGAYADDGNDKIYIPAGSIVYTEAAVERKNDIIILEMGSNGGWHNNYDELISQYWSIINYCGTDRFIILGDTDDPNQNADANQGELGYGKGNEDTLWEAALRNAFGEHFFNTRTYLISQGLGDNNLTWTDEDEDDYENGKISQQLRTDFDNTHLNKYGYYSKGLGVYYFGQGLGYW